jgi:hypothetical protein
MIGYGSVSETAKASVTYEGLISQRLLKVQSSLLRNKKGENHWGGLSFSN